MTQRGRRASGLAAAVTAVTMALAGCTSTTAGTSSSSSPTLRTTTDATHSVTVVTETSAATTETVTGTARTVTRTAGPTTPQPPPTTHEPAPTTGDCPYLTNEQVKDANGQHTGQTTIIATKPYPVCVFTRSDGGYLATTRIITATSPEAAAAAVNQHVPIEKSNPATKPQGWTGGSMGNLDGVAGYPKAESIYAVSKGTIAIVAISNQAQSIKGRQMVTDIVQNLGL